MDFPLTVEAEFPFVNTNLLLTEREGRTREYWPEVVAVRTERSKVRTKTTEGQYSPVRLELARLVSSLLYGTRTMLVLSLPAFENQKYTAYDRFHGNGPYGEIPTKKESIRTLGFTLPYNNFQYFLSLFAFVLQKEHQRALTLITYVGVSISVVALCLAFLTFYFFR